MTSDRAANAQESRAFSLRQEWAEAEDAAAAAERAGAPDARSLREVAAARRADYRDAVRAIPRFKNFGDDWQR